MKDTEICKRRKVEGLSWRLCLLTWLAASWLCAWGAEEEDVRRDAAVRAIQEVMPSVVNVGTETTVETEDPWDDFLRQFFGPYYRRRGGETRYSVGSGVIIDEEGFVLTNYHVVSHATRVSVKLADGRVFEAKPLVGTDITDLALLKIVKEGNERFTQVRFAEDDDLYLGETVLALGNPFGLGGSVSRGILSSKSRRPPTESEPLHVLDWLQTDASINPGNSGGPLINLRGELIGINVAVATQGQGIGFAVPVKRVAAAIAEIYSPETLKSLWFGARVRPGSGPLTVLAVQTESPAGKAGLKPADQIVDVNGRRPKGFMDFVQALTERGEARDTTLGIRRGAEVRKVSFRLVPESSFFNPELVRKKTGLSLQELTPEQARGLGLSEAQGLLVAGVERGSPAGEAKFKQGILITSVDSQDVGDVVSIAKVLYGKARGESLKLGLMIPTQRRNAIRFDRATVEIVVR